MELSLKESEEMFFKLVFNLSSSIFLVIYSSDSSLGYYILTVGGAFSLDKLP